MVPNLLGGKLLTGVLPPDKHDHMEPWLPSHSPIMDIESCIDDPTLAPLGGHIRLAPEKRKHRKKKDSKGGQVKIQRKYKDIHGAGLLMLRRKNLTTDDLAQQLNAMSPLAPFLKQQDMHNSYFGNLVELDISRNKLSSLPAEMAHLSQLRTLNASSNLLTHLPVELYHLTRLEVLLLSQNQLRTIPDELPIQLPCLVTLSVAGNMIDYLTPNLYRWENMRHLQLGSVFGGNLLTRVPDSIINMPHLEELDLSCNQLYSLPSNMYIPSLLHLNVSRNQLDSLPTSIGRCLRLKTLNISKNHLTTLPANLVELDNLELLDISENLLCIMPADILERMKTTLLITGNPLTRPGHCDLAGSSDAYAKVLKRLTMRAVPMITSCSTSTTSSSAAPSPSTSTNVPTATTSMSNARSGVVLAPSPSSSALPTATASTSTSAASFGVHSHHRRHHQCGPQGTGCLGAPLLKERSTSFPSAHGHSHLRQSSSSYAPIMSSSLSSSTATAKSTSTSIAARSVASVSASVSLSSSTLQSNLAYESISSIPNSCNSNISAADMTLYNHRDNTASDNNENNNDDDDDALIDRELSFLAQRLNVQGSRRDRPLPTTPSPTMGSPILDGSAGGIAVSASSTSLTASRVGTPLQEDMFSRSLLMEAVADIEQEDSSAYSGLACTLIDDLSTSGGNSSAITASTNIVHSLRELATRVILQSKIKVPVHMIPPHLANDLSKHNRRWCAKCQQAFVNEWLTSVQVKSYRGHPAVVRRVRFCSTRCWQAYLHSRKSVVCVHRAETQPILRQSAEQEESDWLQASYLATTSSHAALGVQQRA